MARPAPSGAELKNDFSGVFDKYFFKVVARKFVDRT